LPADRGAVQRALRAAVAAAVHDADLGHRAVTGHRDHSADLLRGRRAHPGRGRRHPGGARARPAVGRGDGLHAAAAAHPGGAADRGAGRDRRAAGGGRLQHQPGQRGRADRAGRARHAVHPRLPEPVPAAGDRRHRAHRAAGAGRRRAAGARAAAAHPLGAGAEDDVNWLIDFFADPARWSGPYGIPMRLLEHLEFSALALFLAALIAVPLGLLIGHTGRGHLVVVVSANLARAIPTLGVLVLFVLLLGTASIWPVIIPLVLLAVPPILVNTFEGIRGVDPELRDAAYGMGLRGGQVLGQVLVPVALPLILLGLRLSAIQVVATTTVAAYTALGGLGRFVFAGFATPDYSRVLGGSVLIVLFALVVQFGFTLVQRVTVSPGVSRRRKVREQSPA